MRCSYQPPERSQELSGAPEFLVSRPTVSGNRNLVKPDRYFAKEPTRAGSVTLRVKAPPTHGVQDEWLSRLLLQRKPRA
jgi:hypothetical protein